MEGLAHLTKYLSLTQDHRFHAGCDSKQVPHGIDSPHGVEVLIV